MSRIIIAGSRSISAALEENYLLLKNVIANAPFEITEVVCGGAHGPDHLGARWAQAYQVPLKLFKPAWSQYGRSAGFRRNVAMAQYAEGLIALWDGQSKGTQHMLETMRQLNKPFYVFIRSQLAPQHD